MARTRLKESQREARVHIVAVALRNLQQGNSLSTAEIQMPKGEKLRASMGRELSDTSWQRKLIERLVNRDLAVITDDYKGAPQLVANNVSLLTKVLDDYDNADGLFLASLLFPGEVTVEWPTTGQQLEDAQGQLNANIDSSFSEEAEKHEGATEGLLAFVRNEMSAVAKVTNGNITTVTKLIDRVAELSRSYGDAVENIRTDGSKLTELIRTGYSHLEQKLGSNNRRISDLEKRQEELIKNVQAALNRKEGLPPEVVSVLEGVRSTNKGLTNSLEVLLQFMTKQRKERLEEIASRLKQSQADYNTLESLILEVADDKKDGPTT